MNTEGIDPVGPQPSDPPWARLLFLLVQGREGQWWRAILLVTPLLVLVGVIMAVPPLGWVGGALGAGGLTAALVRRQRR